MQEYVRRGLSLVALFAVVGAVPAQPADDAAAIVDLLASDAELRDLVRHAETHSPALSAVRGEQRVLLERLPQAKALPDPILKAGWAVVPIETRVGPQHGQISLAQTIPAGGKRPARVEVAEAAARAAESRYQAARRRLGFEVSDAYCDFYFLTSAIEITGSNRDLLIFVERSVRKAYEAGQGSYADLIRSQVEIGKLENDLRSLSDRRRAAAERLNHLLHRKPDAALPSPGLPDGPQQLPTDDELRARLAAGSPEIAVLEAELATEDSRIRVAEVAHRPDWTVSLSYLPTGEARVPGTPDSGKDPVIAGFSVSLPLWKGKYHAARREAHERHRATTDRRRGVTDALQARLARVLYEFRNADREIGLYRDTLLPKAAQSFEASSAGVRTGSAGTLELVDAQRVLLDFQLAAERAVAERARALAELNYLLGEEVLRPAAASEEGEPS